MPYAKFIDLVKDRDVKYVILEICCSAFWIQMAKLYSAASKMALELLI